MAIASKNAFLVFLVVSSSPGSFLGTKLLLQPASASSSSSSSSSGSTTVSFESVISAPDTTCDAKSAACFANAQCSGCISGWGATGSSSDCERRFPGVSDEQTCESQGASICCDLGDEKTAKKCLENRLFTDHWTCFMEGFHCSIDDIPCYDANRVGATPSPTPTSTGEPLGANGVPWGASLSSDRGVSLSGSPTSAPTGAGAWISSLGDACAVVANTCIQDSDCVDCYSDGFEILVEASRSGEVYSECRSDYLSAAAGTSASASSGAGTCDVVGSAFCCSGTGCQVEGTSVAYWGCVFDFFGCSTEEARCIGGGSLSFRSDDETYPGNDDFYYGGGVAEGGESATARAGGAAGNGRRSSAAAYACLSAALTGIITAFFVVSPPLA